MKNRMSSSFVFSWNCEKVNLWVQHKGKSFTLTRRDGEHFNYKHGETISELIISSHIYSKFHSTRDFPIKYTVLNSASQWTLFQREKPREGWLGCGGQRVKQISRNSLLCSSLKWWWKSGKLFKFHSFRSFQVFQAWASCTRLLFYCNNDFFCQAFNFTWKNWMKVSWII